MADTKISELAAAGALAGTEPVPVVQSGATKQTTAQDIADLAQSGSTGELRWRLVAAQTIESGGAGENLVFDTEDADDLTIGAPAATWTVPVGGGGIWTLTTQVVFSAQVGSARAFVAIVVGSTRYVQAMGNGEDMGMCSITVRLDDGAVVTPGNVYQSSGSSKTATGLHQAFRIRA